MTLSDIAKIRLQNQHLINSKLKSPKEIVKLMGAMQAQDYSMAKWAVGIRLNGNTEREIVDSLNKGEILRTHLLRPTWHFVSSDDIYWILDLTAPRIKASMKSRHKNLGFTESIIKKSNKIIEKSFKKSKYLTRDEIKEEIEKNKIDTSGNRLSHLLMLAELDGIICSGPDRNNKITYALLQERVPNKIKLKKDEALEKLAKRYFTSHGPASIKDFAWWAGLTLSDSKKAVETNKAELNMKTINSETYYFKDSNINIIENKKSVHLLPAYDEFLISYANRSAALQDKHYKNTVSSNGIFRPVILIDGQVFGLWKRNSIKDKIIIEFELYKSVSKIEKSLILKAADNFSSFTGKKIECSFK